MGVGVPAQQAKVIGSDYTALTCTGTTQAGAAPVLSKMVELTAAANQTGALLPSDADVQEEYNFFNSSATAADVYVPAGHYLNGTQNAELTIAQDKAAKIWQYKPKYWASILTA
jgi:hypothetical protein